MMDSDNIGLGVIGCGGFGLYALQQFVQTPGVSLAGIAGTHRPQALAAAERFGARNFSEVEALVESDSVDLVYIATPPFLHHPQALAALRAGKHVICEKPLALTVAQADEMIAEARKRGLLLATNLMQRYNPLADSVRRLFESNILGECLHATFENWAADESLPPEHWFWDRAKSGGIFVEHGVHFFDLFAGWLGRGEVVAAQSTIRPGTDMEEHVRATVRYGSTTLADFYHGFHQPHRLDRQELRLVFERGDVTLWGWVPTRARVHAIADEAGTRALCDIFPRSRLDVLEPYSPAHRAVVARGKRFEVYQRFELWHGLEVEKQVRYSELLRAMIADQVAWIRDRSHVRVITEENGRESLAMAERAAQLAAEARSPRA